MIRLKRGKPGESSISSRLQQCQKKTNFFSMPFHYGFNALLSLMVLMPFFPLHIPLFFPLPVFSVTLERVWYQLAMENNALPTPYSAVFIGTRSQLHWNINNGSGSRTRRWCMLKCFPRLLPAHQRGILIVKPLSYTLSDKTETWFSLSTIMLFYVTVHFWCFSRW